MEGTVAKIMDSAIPFLLNGVAAVIIYVVGRWIAGVAASLIENMLKRGHVDAALVSFTRHLVYAAIMVFTVLAAIGKVGIQTTSFIAILGAAGLAVGMALQGTLANFAAGVMIILFRPFKIGDTIEAGSILGTVMEIQIFNTIVNTPDNRKIIMPNSKLSGDVIINYSAVENRRIDMTFGVSYSDDLKKAKEVLLELVKADPRVLKDPEPLVAVMELADSSVNLVCRPWVKPDDYWAVRFDLVEKGKVALEKNGLTIPFPQRDVHIHQRS